MKRFWIVLLMLAAVSCDRSVTLSDGDRLSLDKNWQLTREGGSETCEAIVPSTVAGSLYQAGFFGEGFDFATNNSIWIFQLIINFITIICYFLFLLVNIDSFFIPFSS